MNPPEQTPKDSLSYRVKRANQQFYDIVSTSYEQIDGKRDATTEAWIARKLQKISTHSFEDSISGKSLLDIGCGSGFIMRNARPYFNKVIGVDISHKILVPLKKQGYWVVCADTDHIPFKDNCFSTISCFAVLHHLYTYDAFLQECSRVLHQKGIFYSDHDLDVSFRKKFSLLLKIYRFFFDEEKKYRAKEKMVTHELYHFTEVHTNGIPSKHIEMLALKHGFSSVQRQYHWYGLFPLFTKVLLKYPLSFHKGNAPLVSIIARK